MWNRFKAITAIALLSLGLSGCPDTKTVAPPPPPPEPTAEERAAMAREAAGRRHVDLGIAHFEAGNYAEAEHMLLTPEVWQASSAEQLRALKFLAFTYCVSERPQLCRQSFERALQLDPAFDLEPAEQGHPLWGQSYDDARAAQGR
jgi:Tfp pilus assembly protein PilF